MATPSTPPNRRQFLAWCGSATVGTAAGCRQEPAPSPAQATSRPDIPLNVTIAVDREGSVNDRVNAIRIGWAAVSEQPLNLSPIEYDRSDAAKLPTAMLAAARKSDVLIYPISVAAELIDAEAITSLSNQFDGTIEESEGSMLAALRSGLAVNGDQRIGLPLGTPLPAVLSNEPVYSVESWQDYDRCVVDEWQGRAGEPSSPGWAAAMFLWRASGIKQWLFDREDFSPQIDSNAYVAVLEQFITTHDRYDSKRQTPAEIWLGVTSGTLLGGISWWHKGETDVDLHVFDLPASTKPAKVLFDPFALLISLSADCRQSTAAKRFIRWIAGSESNESMRRQIFGTAVNRMPPLSTSQPNSTTSGATAYERWLANQLVNPITLPTLQLQNSLEYYAALDRTVGQALDHELSAQDALSQTAEAWRKITTKVGVEQQLRTWKRAQGLRG